MLARGRRCLIVRARKSIRSRQIRQNQAYPFAAQSVKFSAPNEAKLREFVVHKKDDSVPLIFRILKALREHDDATGLQDARDTLALIERLVHSELSLDARIEVLRETVALSTHLILHSVSDTGSFKHEVRKIFNQLAGLSKEQQASVLCGMATAFHQLYLEEPHHKLWSQAHGVATILESLQRVSQHLGNDVLSQAHDLRLAMWKCLIQGMRVRAIRDVSMLRTLTRASLHAHSNSIGELQLFLRCATFANSDFVLGASIRLFMNTETPVDDNEPEATAQAATRFICEYLEKHVAHLEQTRVLSYRRFRIEHMCDIFCALAELHKRGLHHDGLWVRPHKLSLATAQALHKFAVALNLLLKDDNIRSHIVKQGSFRRWKPRLALLKKSSTRDIDEFCQQMAFEMEASSELELKQPKTTKRMLQLELEQHQLELEQRQIEFEQH
ncbi:MAG: hypothetical protein MHM6MM_003531 [Cercozoa sp. M6MM]